MHARPPRPSLRAFVSTVWTADSDRFHPAATREAVLPTGATYLVVRLHDHPLRLFSDVHDLRGEEVSGDVVVGGPRATAYVRDVSLPTGSVGAELRPGAALLLLGAPAGALADDHVSLEALWGRAAATLRQRLLEQPDLELRLQVFEDALERRLRAPLELHPAVGLALERFERTSDVGRVVRESGYSHRRFSAAFQEAVGITPKRYCRLQRFSRALEWIRARPGASWVELALALGYSDQAHFNRDFKAFSGLTPGRYQALAATWPQHVPLLGA